MPPARPPLPPGPYLVVGLARSGLAAARALAALGAHVIGADAGAVPAEARDELQRAGVAVHERTDAVDLLEGVATVVKSPGVPQDAPVVAAARARAVGVVGELEIGWRLLANEFIAVTGSNGKTTTTELIGHVHRCAGMPVAVAGNVGTAVSELAGEVDPSAVVVCEASSFQLEDTEAFAPDAAVLLNVTEDHLDRHGTLDAYRHAKLQIFARQSADAVAVAPGGLDVSDAGGAARWVRFGEGATGAVDLGERDGALVWRGARLMPVDAIRLRGAHNRENAMAAAAVTLARGVPAEAVRRALETFAGVAHRLEDVATVDGVLYVNDSKATNVASAVVGISSFGAGVHVILGGRGKGGDYAPLAPAISARRGRAYLIGETAPELAAALESRGVPVVLAGDLEAAVAAARAGARAGDVVLLSPACASFDQYRSYEDRGDHFRALVTGAP